MHELSDISLMGVLHRSGFMGPNICGGNTNHSFEKVRNLRAELRAMGYGIRPVVAPVPLDKMFPVVPGKAR